jgi:hypothetical protein
MPTTNQSDRDKPAETLPEKIESSVTGQDKPMDEEHPTAPWGLVWYSYPIALVVVLIVVLLFMEFFWTSTQ